MVKKLILFALWLVSVREQPTLEVKIDSGYLRGTIDPGGRYRQYLGIPYAYTDRENRFKGPLPQPKWEGTFEAVNHNVRCAQWLQQTGGAWGTDDCLRINVYVPLGPSQESQELLPVMVWIHGGGFFEGSGSPDIYGPEYLVTKGVILVAMNYRVNIQGFLCLRTPEAPGNAGLKDQVAALKWVKRNIKAFGGDPDNVTIFGESAGAASVSFHMLSPMSAGLFQRAILQSGSSLAPWALQHSPIHVASLLASVLGYETKDPNELFQIFSNKTNEELILSRVPRKEGNTIVSEILFMPCVEKEIDGEEAFLNDLPYNILSRGEYNKVPIITGINSEEGLVFAAMENETLLSQIKFEKSMPFNLKFPNHKERKKTADEAEKLYMGDEKITKDSLVKLSKMYGDSSFDFPVAAETEFHLKSSGHPVYSYKFSYDGYLNVLKRSTPLAKVPGATHADDLFYMFQPRLWPTPARFLEKLMIDRLTVMWTNFAKFGEPIPETSDLLSLKWRPADRNDPQMYVIDKQLTTERLWGRQSLRFWNETYTKYRRKK